MFFDRDGRAEISGPPSECALANPGMRARTASRVQRRGGTGAADRVHAAAAHGIRGGAGSLPSVPTDAVHESTPNRHRHARRARVPSPAGERGKTPTPGGGMERAARDRG